MLRPTALLLLGPEVLERFPYRRPWSASKAARPFLGLARENPADRRARD